MTVRSAFVPVTTFILLTATAIADENADRNSRMNQCINLLQAQDPRLKNAWRGRCNEIELEKELEAIKPEITNQRAGATFDDSAPGMIDKCSAPLPYKPVSRTPSCGKNSKTLKEKLSPQTVEHIQLPGGGCFAAVPLLLTNKTDFACNAIQTRIACMDSRYDAASDTTTLIFRATPDPRSYTSSVVITAADIKRVGGRVADLVTDAQFALLPASVRKKNVIDHVQDEIQTDFEACLSLGKARDYCERRSITKADQFVQEWLRRSRNPKKDSPPEKTRGDAESLVAAMRARGVDNTLEQWLLFRAIGANEVALKIDGRNVSASDPIYGVSDAVLDYSGLSFGAHQIDIGANSPREVTLFWDVLSAYLSKHRDDSLNKARSMQTCINLPMRLETIAALDLTYKAAPGMTTGLRSDEGKAAYEARLAAYLNDQVAKTNAMGGLFRHSMLARTLFSDFENQNGGARAVERRATEASAGKDTALCAEVSESEDKLMEFMVWRWANGKKILDREGKPVHARYYERYETVRDIITTGAPDGGRSHCN